MAYTKLANVPVDADWLAVRLDTGAIVAVTCTRKRVDTGVCYHAQAQAITAQGAPMLDATGRVIATEFKHNAPAAQVEQMTDAAIARQMLLAVLGEPTSGIAWPASVLSSVSIRVSLLAAPISGAANAGSLL